MKVFRKIFAFLLIFIIVAVVCALIGAGILAIFPNQNVFGFGLKYMQVTNSYDYLSLEENYHTNEEIDSTCLDYVIFESSDFDVSFKRDSALPNNKIYVSFDCKIQGFTMDENLTCDWTLSQDTIKKSTTINVREPSGWKLSNDCSMEVYVPSNTLTNMEISTNGSITVAENFTINNLKITSNNVKSNVEVNASVTNLELLKDYGSAEIKNNVTNATIRSYAGSFKVDALNGNLAVYGTNTRINSQEVRGSVKGNLRFEVENGCLNLDTVEKDCNIISKNSTIKINKIIKALDIIGNDSNIKIDQNGVSKDSSITSKIEMANGKLNLGKNYYKTEITSVKGDINVTQAIAELNILSTSGNVQVNYINHSDYTEADKNITVSTSGNIGVNNIAGVANITGTGKSSIYASFSSVTVSSNVTNNNGDIITKCTNNQNFIVNTITINENDVTFDVGGITEPTTGATQNIDGMYNQYYKLPNFLRPTDIYLTLKTNAKIYVSSI